MDQYVLNLIRLFYFDIDSNTVDAWFDQDFFIFITGDSQWVEKNFRRAGGFDFWHIMALRGL